ncbi:MAG: hypothetical protein ACR2JC_15110 [Chloroflexota bacterium]
MPLGTIHPWRTAVHVGVTAVNIEGSTMNKRKKVAWHKHLKAAKKKEAKQKTGVR